MIISHKYKFIFLKTSKTAGTSIEIALASVCGREDVITWLDPPGEELRKEMGALGPRNWHVPLGECSFRDYIWMISRHSRKVRYYDHMTAREIRETAGESVWNGYYKFCFERNPWDRIISYYYWYHRKNTSATPMTMTEFIRSGEPARLRDRGYYLYTIDGDVAVDRIYRYEDIEGAMKDLTERFRFPALPVLPNAKSSTRTDRRPYGSVLNDEERSLIGEIFKPEIELMGYTF